MVSVSDLLGSIRKTEQHAEKACVEKCLCTYHSTNAVVGSVALGCGMFSKGPELAVSNFLFFKNCI